MSTKTKQITVFEGTWGERVYAFGLDEATTRNAVEDGYAFEGKGGQAPFP